MHLVSERKPTRYAYRSARPAAAPDTTTQAHRTEGNSSGRYASFRVAKPRLPDRARLEAQRAELLRVMECVNRARRTLEQHVVKESPGSERHHFYEQRVLESLDVAKQALATAYPMLERIAEALHVGEILKEHAS